MDEETTVHELRELVKKTLISQKAQWASVLSEWGVYLPHQTDGYLLFTLLFKSLLNRLIIIHINY